ncbi:uncharacterized protein TNCV_4574191 [Trichonephila clavipes]|nr:uncharacterized protein TNCV_4574191 [Trichonephila clavipes]
MAGMLSSIPVPLKTRRVGQRCTLNLSRAETSSRWCGVVVRRGGASSGVVHVDHGSKLRGPSPKALNRETPSEQWTHMPYRTPMQHDPASQRNSVSNTIEEIRKREKENNALALLAKFCNSQCYKLTKYPIRKPINKSHQKKMDVARKQNSDAKHCNNPDAKKGKQLTSIIDQLTINKTKDAVPESKTKKKDSQIWQHQFKNVDVSVIFTNDNDKGF